MMIFVVYAVSMSMRLFCWKIGGKHAAGAVAYRLISDGWAR